MSELYNVSRGFFEPHASAGVSETHPPHLHEYECKWAATLVTFQGILAARFSMFDNFSKANPSLVTLSIYQARNESIAIAS